MCDGNDIFLHFVIDKYIQILHNLVDTKEISYKIRCLNIQVMHCNEFDITTCTYTQYHSTHWDLQHVALSFYAICNKLMS